jgi:NTE family protein
MPPRTKKTPSTAGSPKQIAIACQGGGSHTAFTAGVLQALLRNIDPAQHQIIALSGTSGGAMCAALAWYGLLQGKPALGADLLESFWQEMSTRDLPDALTNQFLLWLQRSSEYLALPEISPYQLLNTGQEILTKAIERHIDFTALPGLLKPSSPHLLVGAVEVLSGEFTVFNSHHADAEKRISSAALLASAAIPDLFRAVQIGQGVYWDGLFSENPPIRDFLAGQKPAAAKPDEIWIIQINPDQRQSEPKSNADITDRRNELAGNLSLKQELFFVQQTNDWLEEGWLKAEHFKPVEVRHIPLAIDLDYPSKLDRSPAFINSLLHEGRRVGVEYCKRFTQA